VYIPPLPCPGSLNALAEIVAHLRSPEGCPWDREQTHASLRASLLEEAYEVLEAIDEDDMPHLQEELGDLLLHVLLQAQIAQEAGEFLLTNVIEDISAKLIRRHPHVFGDAKVNSTDEIVANWEKIKAAENGGQPRKKSRVPRGLPALAHAQKIAHHEKVKVKLADMAGQLDKLGRSRKREEALGQLLFALAAYASDQGFDAESALRDAAARYERAHAE
jgi:tetrapyrrole methylase family protein/MazG family protein